MDRSETRQAAGVLRAIRGAFEQKLGKEWFEALAEDDAEASAMHERHQVLSELERD